MIPLITEPPELLTVETATRLLNIGKSTTYDLIRAGRLRSVKIGRRRLVPREAIREMITALSEDSA